MDAANILDSLFTAIKDLCKFKIVNSINTGDRNQDNLITAVLLIVLTFVFTKVNKEELIYLWYHWIIRPKVLDSRNVKYYNALAIKQKSTFSYYTWLLPDTPVFTINLCDEYIKIQKVRTLGAASFIDVTTKKIDDSSNKGSLFTLVRASLTVESPMPIYGRNDKVICLCRTMSDTVLLAYTSTELLHEFIDYILTRSSSKQTGTKLPKSIYDINNAVIGTIYSDRSLDLFVSRHKKDIINAVDTFIATNKGKKQLGGYGSYNLGIMLHGDPGTGKTMLIKALANYLNRDVIMVDMRKIKTRATFKDLFSSRVNVIYCLDEFDCVQGAIKSRSTLSDVPLSEINELTMLKERQLELLKLSTINTSTTGINPITQELANVDKKISDLENSLTLDTVLTCLDGINEMRNRLIIATTNHLEAIDPALLRPGRFDLKINLGKFNTQEISDLLIIMFKDTASAKILKLISTTKFKENQFAPVDIIYYATIIKNVKDLIDYLKA